MVSGTKNKEKSMKKILAMLTIAMLMASCGGAKDPIDQQVEELLSKMTLREKAGQMHQVSGGAEWSEAAKKGEIGSILNCVDPEQINAIQRVAVEESRLGIPILVSRDVIHGFRTIFPIPLGLASTFDPAIVEQGARIAAIEATASGVRWTFSPMLDIARDPRWGRVAEGSGEDPYLDVQMGVAMVKGYQGDDLSDPTSMAACIKHFVGYGAAEGGRDYNSTMISERSLRNTYFPAFKATAEAGAATLMTSFNEIDGVPSTGNKWLLKDVLRGEWGWDGMIVTDWNSAGEMIAHGFSRDLKHTAEQMCALLSETPAKLYGAYPRKGVIAEGSDADIVVYEPNGKTKITAADQVCNVDYAPYEDFEITGHIAQVYLRGTLAVNEGTVIEDRGGQYIPRGKSML